MCKKLISGLQLLPSLMETYEKACVEGCCVEVQSLPGQPRLGEGNSLLGCGSMCGGQILRKF